MNASKCNHEGYSDPTAYQAVSNITYEEKLSRINKRLIYVCSKYKGDIFTNMSNAKSYCKFVLKEGYIPLAPHLLYPQFIDDNDILEREVGSYIGLFLLTKCDEIWIFGSYLSEGMNLEFERAKSLKIPIRYFTKNLEEVKT